MPDDRWQRIKQIFQKAIDLSPQERADFLTETCSSDLAMLSEVEALLVSHEQAGSFIEEPAGKLVSENFKEEQTKTVSGSSRTADLADHEISKLILDYELVRVCGEGAFGKVWIVKDRVGAFRAMKVIMLGKLVGMGVSQRELEALGTYCRNVPTHVNLVQIFHIGQTEDLLYYTMELADDLISRRPIRKKLSSKYQPLTLRGVL